MLVVDEHFDPMVWQQFEDAIDHYNMAVTGHHSYATLNVLLRDDQGAVQGGALGGIWGEWCYLKFLFVAEPWRRQGWGSHLLQHAEAHARAATCRGIYLETYSFQGYAFYLRHNFVERGQVPDFPPGHTFYLLMKYL